MKHIRFVLFSLLALLICIFSGCGLSGDQEYTCDVDNVVSVQIVHLDGFVKEEYRDEYTILCEIEDIPAFVEQLESVEHSVNWGDPRPLGTDCIVIRIEYQNGDYDLLHEDAQSFHRSGQNNSGFFFFDDNQFQNLISEYLPQ